jgi:UPF0176 protein
MQKIILFYTFSPLPDPEVVRLWQTTLCKGLKLRGRIIISKQGINGTLGGDIEDLKDYVKSVHAFTPFKAMAFKWSHGSREDFPKLSVKVRDEIVTFGVADELRVNEQGVVGGGKHLKPDQLHKLIEERGDDVVFFDGRSSYEAKVGKFKDAVVPEVRTAKDFVKELDSGKYEALKDKPVVTYCTGGIRCEILSSLMKNRGFKEVYQLEGGIVKYGEAYGYKGLWEGSLYVFDKRMGMKFGDNTEDIGECIHCQAKTSNYENCAQVACNDLVLICKDCRQVPEKLYCSTGCQEITAALSRTLASSTAT